MSKQDKQRLIIATVIVIAAVILWLLFRRAPGVTVQQNAGSTAPLPTYAAGGELAPVPPLNVDMGSHTYISGAKGCLMCYSGYQRIETPVPAPVLQPQPASVIYNLNTPNDIIATTYGIPYSASQGYLYNLSVPYN